MKKQLFSTILMLGLSIGLVAQNYEFGKVSKAELEETKCPIDDGASASVLYKFQNTYLVTNSGNTQLVTEIYERIKIYGNEGLEYASKSIPLYKTKTSEEKVSRVKAATYNLEGGKVVTSELNKSDIFKTDMSYNFNQVSFTLPNVKDGSVIEFSYKISSPFIWNIDEFRFQYTIPIMKMNAELRTPKGYRFKQTFKGYQNVYPNTYTKLDNRIGMEVVVNEYQAENMPALEEEQYVDNLENYCSGVIFELVSVDLPGFSRSYAQTWKDVAQYIGGTTDYKNELDKSRSFDDELDVLLADAATPMEKTKRIFKYVKDNITWNGYDGKYFYNGLKKTLKEKKGNAADINLLLVAMLRYAGINANPVVISTKDNLIPIFPTRNRMNYVIAYAEVDEKPIFMDATDEFSDLNVLPVKDYNWKGILIDNPKQVWRQINLLSPGTSRNMYSVDLELNSDGSAEGTFNSRYDRHSALKFRTAYAATDEEAYITEKESMYHNIEISDYEVTNASGYEGTVSEKFSFYDEEAADIVDTDLYIQPLLFLGTEENPFKSEKREYPVDFGFPFKDVYMMKLKLPEGYQVKSCPKSQVFGLPDKLGLFKYNVIPRENQVDVIVNFEIKNASIASIYYPYLKEFFNQIITKESEKLVLSKI